jgi:hypothetical protein
MTPHKTPSRNRKPFITGAFLAAALPVFCLLGRFTPPLCILSNQPTWLFLEILHVLFGLLDWYSVSNFFFGDCSFVQHLLQLTVFLSAQPL